VRRNGNFLTRKGISTHTNLAGQFSNPKGRPQWCAVEFYQTRKKSANLCRLRRKIRALRYHQMGILFAHMTPILHNLCPCFPVQLARQPHTLLQFSEIDSIVTFAKLQVV